MPLLRLRLAPFFSVVRTAKRRGVKAQRLAAERKKAAGLEPKRAEPEKSKQKGFFGAKAGQKGSVILQYPKFPLVQRRLLDKPADDVWLKAAYKKPVYSIAEAVAMHRELQHPTMYNNISAPVVLRLDLDMELEKKNHYLENTSRLIMMPHFFPYEQKRTILAFVKSPELQSVALEAGAEFVGGPDMVKKIQKGLLRIDDVDFAVCHLDMVTEISSLRGIMRKKFPQKRDGAFGDDIAAVIKRFRTSLLYDIVQDIHHPAYGMCQAIVGKLDMETEQLEENIQAFVESVCAVRPHTLSPFIRRSLLMVQPLKENFSIDISRYTAPKNEEPKAAGRSAKKASAVAQ